jgi:hypothetical protein
MFPVAIGARLPIDRNFEQRAQYHRPQPSSASRFTAAQAGFFILSQSNERPER